MQTGKGWAEMGEKSDEVWCFLPFQIAHGLKFMSAFGCVHGV